MKWSRKNVIFISFLVVSIIVIPILTTRKYPDKPIDIRSDEDFAKYDFAGSGTEQSPFLIEDLWLKPKKNDYSFNKGIFIYNTTKHFVIQNCLIEDYYYGIYIREAAPGTVSILNNEIYYIGSIASGIEVLRCNNSLIKNNVVAEGGGFGIEIYESHNSTIESNTCYNTNVGIYSIGSHFSSVISNNCTNNAWGYTHLASNFTKVKDNVFQGYAYGREPSYGDNGDGAHIMSSFFIEFKNNTCTDSSESGIDVWNTHYSNFTYNLFSLNGNPKPDEGFGAIFENSSNNNISFNDFSLNEEEGLVMLNSDDNLIHHNAFIDNWNKVENSAREESSINNIWYDTILLEGNYWHSWNISNPFVIKVSGSEDLYPLVENPLV